MLISFTHSQTSVILRVKLRDSSVSTGAGKTGLTSSSSGLIISTIADNEASATVYAQASSNIETITTLGTFAAPTSSKCRFKEVDSTNHKGIYEIQIADARFAVSSAKFLIVSISGVTNLAECDVVIPLGLAVNTTAIASTPKSDISDTVVAAFADDVGTAQAGASGTITLRSGAVATDDYYNGAIVSLTGGTGAGQSRKITDYVGSTKVATCDSNWATTPDNTSTYIVIGRSV